jgi:hypothetical protein
MSDIEPNYSIRVYDNYAVIRGKLPTYAVLTLMSLGKKEGFTHMACIEVII